MPKGTLPFRYNAGPSIGPTLWERLGMQNPLAPAPTPREQPRILPKGWAEGPIPQSNPITGQHQPMLVNRQDFSVQENPYSLARPLKAVWNAMQTDKPEGYAAASGGTNDIWGGIKGIWNKYWNDPSTKVYAPGDPRNVQPASPPEEEDVFVEEQDPRDAANDAKLASIGGSKHEMAPKLPSNKKKPTLMVGSKKAQSNITENKPVENTSPYMSKRVAENNVFEETKNPTSFTLDNFEPQLNSGKESDSSLYVNDDSPAMSAYQKHIQEMPEYQSPGIWGKLGSALVGAMEGGRNGAAAGFQAGRAAMLTPYEERLNRWGQKGAALKDAASLEAGSMSNYLKAMNIDSQIRRRDAQTENDSIRTKYYGQNSDARMQNLELNRQRLIQQGYVQVTNPQTGTVMFTHKSGQAPDIDTGIPSMEWEKFQQQKHYQNGMLGQGATRIRQGNERLQQGWSREEEGKRRWNFDNIPQ